MKKSKRICAIIGIICLAGLYISTLVFAFIDTTTSLVYLKCSIGATIFFPVILYVLTIFHKIGNPTEPVTDSASDVDSSN